jgi:Tfp pilus assembly protein PilF
MNKTSATRLASFVGEIDLSDYFVSRMYPAPPAVDLMKVDIAGMSLNEIRKNLSEEELWQAANHFLKQKQYELADTYYKQALKKNKSLHKVRALRGLLRICRGDYRKANTYLSRALLEDASLEDARLWLAYIRLKEGKTRSVSHQLGLLFKSSDTERVISSAYLLRAMQYIKAGKIADAETALHQVLSYQDEFTGRYILACAGFLKGEELYQSGKYKEAIRVWVDYAEVSKDAWNGVSHIAAFFHGLATDAQYAAMLTAAREDLRAASQDLEKYYWYVCLLLCGLSLLPEFYESYEALPERLEFWRKRKLSSTMYPYAHFRYALCLLYSARPSDAYDELLSAREKMPASKQGYFRIAQLIDHVADLR